MASFRRAFFAYPAIPTDLRYSVEKAAEAASTKATGLHVQTWAALDILGAHISDAVRQEIDRSQFLIADITVQNYNVYYEIGFAIGRGIPILPVVNESHTGSSRSIQTDGFFDNIKYELYQNSGQLSSAILKNVGSPLLDIYAHDLNIDQPLFILDTYIKTDFRNEIVSAVKGSKVFFRSFDPVETPRFSTIKIISEATSSVGAVIPFLAPHIRDADRHNLRASYLAGIMHGLNRPALLIQHGDTPIPADYREEVRPVQNPEDVGEMVREFASESLKSVQHINRVKSASYRKRPKIQTLWLGASAAENEFRTLEQYFLQTSEYIQALNGTAKIIVGRKGSGKTAIFFMVRENLRKSKSNTVVDLKPDSHELVKLRELLQRYVSAGVVSHTFSGFWLAIISVEILLTLRKDANVRAKYDHKALDAVITIERALEALGIPITGDFTSRLNAFVNSITGGVNKVIKETGGRLPADRLTNFVYGDEQKNLRDLIVRFSSPDGVIGLLFDNLDKGWPATGVKAEDILFLKSLIESLNRLQRELSGHDVEFRFSVFIRNDVYELLVAETTDRGKEGAVRIDWSDREKLRLVIGKRIAASTDTEKSAVSSWNEHFPNSVEGRDGLDYAIDHSLMRPRFLIDIVERAISFAINREHDKVTDLDLKDAVRQHANYLVDDFGYEIRDASSVTNEIIDAFLGANQNLRLPENRGISVVHI